MKTNNKNKNNTKDFGFTQLFDKSSSTFTYLIWDKETKEGILIDSVLEQVERDYQYIKELGIDIKYFLETHVHADHVSGVYKFLRLFPKSKCIYGVNSGVDTKVVENVKLVKDEEILTFGKDGRFSIKFYSTPGHTDGDMTMYFEAGNSLFTGDTLHVRACGRTDFQGGSNRKLYDSIMRIYKLFDDSTILYPGHDYKVFTHCELGESKKYSKRLREGQTYESFEKSMNEVLKTLPLPQKIFFAVPANQHGGIGGCNHLHEHDGKKLYSLAGLTEDSFNLAVKKYNVSKFFHLSTDKKEKEFFEKHTKKLGVEYVWMPFTPSDITNEKLDGYCKMVDDHDGHVCTSCLTENRSRFMTYYFLKKNNVKDADYDSIMKFIHGEVMVSYLKKLDDPDFDEPIDKFFGRMAGASVDQICTASPSDPKHSECGL